QFEECINKKESYLGELAETIASAAEGNKRKLDLTPLERMALNFPCNEESAEVKIEKQASPSCIGSSCYFLVYKTTDANLTRYIDISPDVAFSPAECRVGAVILNAVSMEEYVLEGTVEEGKQYVCIYRK
ncbi:unnamed protein product, partial [marine sediment metagenome]